MGMSPVWAKENAASRQIVTASALLAFNMDVYDTTANPICQPQLANYYHERGRKCASNLDS
jgi:hypothetical protein